MVLDIAERYGERIQSAILDPNPGAMLALALDLAAELQTDPDDEPADEPAADPPAEDDEAESTDEPAGSEDMTVSEPAEDVEVPNLDVDKFTMKVVRLVKNFQNLLNIEEAIINRTKNFLDDNYGEAFVREFTDNLSQKYGLEVKEFDNIDDVSDENFAVGAFAGGTGSLPTGGGG